MSQANFISSYDSSLDQGKTMHIIHLDGGAAFGIVSHNSLTREIRKTGTDKSNRSYKGVGSVKWKGAENSRASSTYPHTYTI